MSRANLLIITVIGLLFFSSCSSVEIAGVEKLEYNNEKVDVYLKLRNPNSVAIEIDGLDMDLIVGNFVLKNINLDTVYKLPAHSEAVVAVSYPLRGNLIGSLGGLFTLLLDNDATMEARGTVEYKVLFLKFNHEFNQELKINN